MKVLFLCNEYRSRCNGEARVVSDTDELLQRSGVATVMVRRSSRELEGNLGRQLAALALGSYDPRSAHHVAAVLARERPDVVHAHNLYPLLTPSVLVASRKAGVPVVVSVHNYGLTCPAWHHFRDGAPCERCLGPGHELHCVLGNCLGRPVESAAYAFRSFIARRWRLFLDNVAVFIALSEFAKAHLARAGFPSARVVTLPNMTAIPESAADPGAGEYVAFAGRLSPEKGLVTLLAAARRLPRVPFRIAGDGPAMAALRAVAGANVTFTGFLDSERMAEFYCRARCVVVPSLCYEGCPLVVCEAMAQGLPVVASRLGGLGELVADGVTGSLFPPGDAAALADRVAALWDEPASARTLGAAGRRKAECDHAAPAYLRHLLAIYRQAGELAPGSR